MSFSIYSIFIIACVSLLFMFGIAWATEKGFISEKVTRHPLIYTLSLGAYAGGWVLFGAVGLTQQLGFGFLTYFFGASCMFLFAPLLLQPMLNICRTHQLSSLADVFSFRFNSKMAGALTTVLLVIASMPLIGLQIEVVINTTTVMAGNTEDKNSIGLLLWAMLIIFTFVFGSQNISASEQHKGLIAAIAFESLFKLLAFLLVGLFAWLSFQDIGGLQKWLEANPEQITQLHGKLSDGTIHMMILIFFSSVIVMPHAFHMLFAEHPSSKSLRMATWGMPLYLFLLSLPLLLILWAGTRMELQSTPDFYTLLIGYVLSKPWLTVLAYMAGLSAASSSIIVLVLSLSIMALNHLVLPLLEFVKFRGLHFWLVRVKRFFIVILVSLGYLFHQFINDHHALTEFTFMAFAMSLQFMPGIIACFYWPKANKHAFVFGIAAGFIFLIGCLSQISSDYFSPHQWNWLSIGSVACNLVVFIAASLLCKQSNDDQHRAELCSPTELPRAYLPKLSVTSVEELTQRLALLFDQETAEQEVKRAMKDLGFSAKEQKPRSLSQLRQQLLANLSGLLGPGTAQTVLDQVLPFADEKNLLPDDINSIEEELEPIRKHFTGLMADIDRLRRHHQEIVRNLPIGAFSLNKKNEILMWNRNMEVLTGIASTEVVSGHLEILPSPWQNLFLNFANLQQKHTRKQELLINGKRHWFSLHKSEIQFSPEHQEQIIMVEDLTETSMLEQELIHQERLASIGRLAAGVAHEIGNPVTGIACLAQNLEHEDEFSEVKIAAQQITDQTTRISSILQSLMRFAYQSGGSSEHTNFENINLKSCADEAIKLLELDKDATQVIFENNIPLELHCFADGQQIQQVMINLLANARDASEINQAISIAAEETDEGLLLSITDQGSGIPAELMDSIFEPFVTSKEPGSGTGLGLALVYRIIEQHGGSIHAKSPIASNRGSQFEVLLPYRT